MDHLLPIAAALVLAAGSANARPRVFPAMPRVDPDVRVLDVTGQPWSVRASAACLQGIVNRKRPRLYLVGSPYDTKWLDWIRERGYVRAAHPVADLAAAVGAFRKEVRGCVTWDPALPGTVNIATMEASLRGAIAASPEQAASLRLPVLLDLRGRWKTEGDALNWSLEHLQPRMAPGLVASIFPTADSQQVRDYAVAARIFTFWADDAATLRKVLRTFARGTAIVGYWGHGWPDQPGYRGLTEYDGLMVFSRLGHFSSGSEFSSNWSLFAGICVPDEAFRRKPLPAPALDRTKAYLAVHVVESGDALWYWQSRQRDIWEDKDLGAAPMGWSVNPTALDVIAPVLEWYYRRAPANQEFYCAVSGLGYFAAPELGADLPDRSGTWDDQCARLRPYLRALSLPGVAMWTGPWRLTDDAETVLAGYARRLPEARYLLPDMGRPDNVPPSRMSYLAGSCAVFHCATRWRTGPAADREAEIAWLVDEIRHNTPAARPAFVSAMAYSWVQDPGTIREVMTRLGPGFVAVTPSQLADLYRQTAGGSEMPRSGMTR